MTTYAQHAKESGHWYDRHTRQLVETVTLKNGRQAPPTLRHARPNFWLPGQTKITNVADKPQLNAWKQRQMVMAALTLPRKAGETDEQFLERLDEDGGAQAAKARDDGTAIHGAVKEYYTTGRVAGDPIMLQHVMGVQRVLDSTFGAQSWIPEQVVVHHSGFATAIDLHSHGGVGDRPIVLDFKTKEFGPNDTAGLKAYDDHDMQLAAGGVAMHGEYATGSVLDGLMGAIVYISRTHPGLSWPVSVVTKRLIRGWDKFRCLLKFWQIDNDYDPSWEETPS